MDGVIEFKSSRIERFFLLLCVALAFYWVGLSDTNFLIKLLFCLLLTAILLVPSCKYGCIDLKGRYRLTEKGVLAIDNRINSNKLEPIKFTLIQRLPWCLNIEIKTFEKRTRKLVWKDSLSPDDWRKFRQYMHELQSETEPP